MSPDDYKLDWLHSCNPRFMFGLVGGSASVRKQHLLGTACCYRLLDLLIDPRHVRAIAVAEEYADGRVDAAVIREANAIAYLAWENLDVDCGPEREPGDPGYFEPLLGIAQLHAADATQLLTLDEARGIGGVLTRCEEAVSYRWGFRSKLAADETNVFAGLLRDIFGNPFQPVAFDPRWRTEHTVGIAAKMYDDRDFAAMPILADALEEAGCENADILLHCREPGVHVRGCWVVDLVLGKA